MSNGIEGLKEMAYLYQELRHTMSQFPSSIDDFIDTPDWFIAEEDDEDNEPLTQMIYRADRLANEVLGDV